MKNNLVRAGVLLLGWLACSQVVRGQFQLQDDLWQQSQQWAHNLSLPNQNFAYGLAVDTSNRVYVATGSQIVVFNPNGVQTQAWSVAGVQDIVLYPGSNLLFCACLTATNQIQVYTTNGTLVRQWGGSGSGTGQISTAYGIAISTNGLVYVADAGNNRISVYDSFGNFTNQWGQFGGLAGSFNSPRHLAIGLDNTVYVADYSNARIQSFDAFGNYLGQYQSTGWDPKGVIVSADNGFIIGYDSSGAAIWHWFAPGLSLLTTWGYLNMRGLAVSPDGQNFYYMDTTYIYRSPREYHTLGQINPQPLPIPAIVGVVPRPGTGLVDIDYLIIDPGTSVVQVAALAFANGRSDLGGAIPMVTYAEGTGSLVGSNITTGVKHRLTWNVGVDFLTTNSSSYSVNILAKDSRGLLDFHFITIPPMFAYTNALTISRTPYLTEDFQDIWTWLAATGDPNISLQTGSVFAANSAYGVSNNTLLAQTQISGASTTTVTTTSGQTFLYAMISSNWQSSIYSNQIVRAARTDEVFRAEMGTTGKVTQWQPGSKLYLQRDQIFIPRKYNEFGFDTGLFNVNNPSQVVCNAWWAVMVPGLP